MSHPNIVLITCHDIGRRLNCYGWGNHSPRLDQLASEGLLCRQAFCTQAQCSPARASLTTGRWPHNNGVMGLCHSTFAWDLNDDEETMAQFFTRHGYTTGLAGLQHESVNEERLGFHQRLPCRKGAKTTAADGITLLNQLNDSDQPFFMQCGFYEGHREPHHENGWGDFEPSDAAALKLPEFIKEEESARRDFSYFDGSIAALDAGVGAILDEVDRLHLREQTIIIFTTDHGIPFPRAKTSCYDPGLEVALMLRGPGIKTGASSNLTSHIDVLPTLCDLIGVEHSGRFQGASFIEACRGETGPHRDEIFGEQNYHNYGDPVRSIRTPTHKLIVNFLPVAALYNSTQQWRPETTTVIPANPKGTLHPLVELFDLVADPNEWSNVADDESFVNVREELLFRLKQHMQTTNDPLLKGRMPMPKRFQLAVDLIGQA